MLELSPLTTNADLVHPPSFPLSKQAIDSSIGTQTTKFESKALPSSAVLDRNYAVEDGATNVYSFS